MGAIPPPHTQKKTLKNILTQSYAGLYDELASRLHRVEEVEAFAHRQIEAAEGTELHGNAAVPASNSAERRLCLKVSEKKLF